MAAPPREDATLLKPGGQPAQPWYKSRAFGAVAAAVGVLVAVFVIIGTLRQGPTCVVPSAEEVALNCSSFVRGAKTTLYAHATQPPAVAPKIETMEVVIAFCDGDLDWLPDYVKQLRSLSGGVAPSVYVYAKCSKEATVENLPDDVPLHIDTTLPNIGRCDHTYAHHLAVTSRGDAPLANVTFFIKDTLNPNHPQERVAIDPRYYSPLIPLDSLRSVPDFYGQVAHNGFACGYDAGFFERGSSHWHEFDLTGMWMMDAEAPENHKYSEDGFTATVRPLRAWLANLTRAGGGHINVLTQANRLWPICYGGNFAATSEAVRRQPPQLWAALEASLARGPDSLEEGHFAERSWAGLMALPPTPTQEAGVRAMAYDTVNPSWCNSCSIVGQLLPACGAPACRSG